VLDPGAAKAVGFKIKYEELLLPDHAWLLEWLKGHREIRVIHLRRENRLKRLISQITATTIYGLYNVTSEDQRPLPARVALTPEACLEDFERTEAREALFRAYFTEHVVLETTYEAILSDRDHVLDEIATFLHVRPAAMTTPTLKINPDDLHEMLDDY